MSNEFSTLIEHSASHAEELFTFIIEKGFTFFEKEDLYDTYLKNNYSFNPSLYEPDHRHCDL